MVNIDTRKCFTYRFRWLSAGRVPPRFDLRACGRTLEESRHSFGPATCIDLFHAAGPDDIDWSALLAFPGEVRRNLVILGVGTAQDRARLLEAGFGEAFMEEIEPGEFEARVRRLAELSCWLPRHRRLGPLELDLLAREAFGHGKSLNLNPREFALIWRLADTPGEAVSKQALIQDVWRMGFIPETNSIAVHMSRLRRKLGFVGMSGIIATATAGGYCLLIPQHTPPARPAQMPQMAHLPAHHTMHPGFY